jgi:hypothetical protein
LIWETETVIDVPGVNCYPSAQGYKHLAFIMQRSIATRLALILLGLMPLLAVAQAPGERSAVLEVDCDYQCLIGFARGYMDGLKHRDPARVKFSRSVRFTENNVEMAVGKQGLWATVTGVAATGLEAADTTTGEAAWIGTADEHGLPVYYGMRLQVRARAITEVETIVVRTTGLPLPFGDVKKVVHDPAFAEVLPSERRRPRERLRAVADSYFNTVELNDGMVFAPFTDDCGRLENGILTTAAGPGSAGAIAAGCEAQFKLGIYRINKRIRERRYPLIDVERGVVVSTGFFDHANEFDTYKTTDGVERKTALKWPNSISLVEAFKIVDGRIHRIEAVFTYVPYFMHSPFYEYPPAPSSTAQREPVKACDSECLVALMDRYMDALVTQRPDGLPWADEVRFTENGVGLRIGEGGWGSARSKAPGALRVADPETGNVAWYGVVSDHDLPAYYGVRMKVRNQRIAEVETFVARARNPGPFADAAKFGIDSTYSQSLSPGERQSRKRMIAAVEAYRRSVLDDGKIVAALSPRCVRIENGAAVTNGQAAPAVVAKDAALETRGCEAQLKLGLYKPVDDLRSLRIAAVDEERGLVVATSFADFGLHETRYTTADGKQRETQDKYPSTREQFEVYKIRSGVIERIDALSVFQPYLMPLAWQ